MQASNPAGRGFKRPSFVLNCCAEADLFGWSRLWSDLFWPLTLFSRGWKEARLFPIRHEGEAGKASCSLTIPQRACLQTSDRVIVICLSIFLIVVHSSFSVIAIIELQQRRLEYHTTSSSQALPPFDRTRRPAK